MSDDRYSHPAYSAGARLAAMAVVGIAVGICVAAFGKPVYAPAGGWAAAAATFLIIVWATVARVPDDQTWAHASREDNSLAAAHVLVTAATIASFGAVALLLVEASGAKGVSKVAIVALALTTVAMSWLLTHTLFALRYAAEYYSESGGIDFNESEPPAYLDFLYFAFTLGMTFQVSDTSISSRTIRGIALRHGMLSYLIGAVVLAMTVNLVSGLAK